MIKHKGTVINLGDKDYTFAPLTLGSIELLQEKLSKIDSNFSLKDVSIIIEVAHRSLVRNYPEITREEVADLVDISNMQEIFMTVMNMSEMKSQTVVDDSKGESEEKK